MGDENTIGGHTDGRRNLLSGNEHGGVVVSGGSSNVILGNHIGVDASGQLALGNGESGVEMFRMGIGPACRQADLFIF